MTIIVNGPGEMTLGTADRAAAIAAVKGALRLSRGEDDALVAAFAETALGVAERFVGRVMIARAMSETLDADPRWQALGATPVRSITGVATLDEIGVPTPLSPDLYAIDLDTDGTGWVRTTGVGGRIAVSYVAGVADGWDRIATPLRQGAVLLAAHLYDQRDAATPPPVAVTALWRPYRTMALVRRRRAC